MHFIFEHRVGWVAAPSVLTGAMHCGASSEAAAARPSWWEPTICRLLQSRPASPAVLSDHLPARDVSRPGAPPTGSCGSPSMASLQHRHRLVDSLGADFARWTQIVEGRPVQVPIKHYRNVVCRCKLRNPFLLNGYGCVTKSRGHAGAHRYFSKSPWVYVFA